MKTLWEIVKTTLLIVFAFVGIYEGGDRLFSYTITDPIVKNISNRAVKELTFPPTRQELIDWSVKLEREGVIKNHTDLELYFYQFKNNAHGYLSISYYESYLIYGLRSNYKETITLSSAYPGDISITNNPFTVNMEGEEFAYSNLQQQRQYTDNAFEIELEAETDANDTEPIDHTGEDIGTDAGLLLEDPEGDPLDEAEYSVFINGELEGRFYNSSSAISFAEGHENSEVYVPNTLVWDNIPVDLFVDDVFVSNFTSKTDALAVAVYLENAKLIRVATDRVVWDNYPGRECRTCDSPIQDQY